MKNTIKAERTKSRMTQQKLADKAGVSRQTDQLHRDAALCSFGDHGGQRPEELFILESEDWENNR